MDNDKEIKYNIYLMDEKIKGKKKEIKNLHIRLDQIVNNKNSFYREITEIKTALITTNEVIRLLHAQRKSLIKSLNEYNENLTKVHLEDKIRIKYKKRE